jgi:ligand-binding SRPBCC domain-containing protein
VLRVKITEIKRPDYFADEQVEGDFKMMKHEHYFKPVDNGTIIIDQFHFKTTKGWIGNLFSQVYLEKYLTRLLIERNNIIKKIAESNQWKQFLEK